MKEKRGERGEGRKISEEDGTLSRFQKPKVSLRDHLIRPEGSLSRDYYQRNWNWKFELRYHVLHVQRRSISIKHQVGNIV